MSFLCKTKFKRISNFYSSQMPGILDWFGWCTWDAFYTDVSAEGVRQGIQRYARLCLGTYIHQHKCMNLVSIVDM